MFHQGDIIIVKFPFSNLIEFKLRPALVISSQLINANGDYLVVQITTKVKNDGLSFPILEKDLSIPLQLKSYLRMHKIFIVEEDLTVRKISSMRINAYTKVINEIHSLIEWHK